MYIYSVELFYINVSGILSIFFLLLDAALLWAWHAYSVFGFFLYPSIHVSMSRAGGVPINIDIQFGLFYINESDTIYFFFGRCPCVGLESL